MCVEHRNKQKGNKRGESTAVDRDAPKGASFACFAKEGNGRQGKKKETVAKGEGERVGHPGKW